MINKGIVTETNAGMLTIAFDRPEACGDCHNCMRGSEDCKKHLIRVAGDAHVGDVVTVELDDSHVVIASAIAYLVPLTGFLLGLAAGYFLQNVIPINGELLMSATAVIGTGIAYLIMKIIDPYFSKGRWEPQIISVEQATE